MRQDLDLATRLTDESENLAKAKACALADWLGREKGFENAGKNFRRHSNARVLDGQHYIIAGLRLPDFMVLKISLPGGDGERSLAVHRSEEHTSELQSLMRISYAVYSLNTK